MGRIPDFSREQWDALHKRLTVHAHYKIMRLSWRGLPRGRGQLLPDGQGAADVASDAIVRVVNGDRACTATTIEEMLQFLMGVVSSIVSDAVRSPENRSLRVPSQEPSSEPGGSRCRLEDPGSSVAEAEAHERLRQAIRSKVEADPLALGVFDCLANDVTSPSEMAVLLDVPVSEVHKAQKRLRTAVTAVLVQQERRHMAGLERFDNRVWDRFFDFLAPDVEAMSPAEIDSELQRAGIDTSAAFRRVVQALEAREARQALERARHERISAAERLRQLVIQPVENARQVLADMIAARVPAPLRPVYNSKLEKVATDADVQSLLEDLKRLEELESGGPDGKC